MSERPDAAPNLGVEHIENGGRVYVQDRETKVVYASYPVPMTSEDDRVREAARKVVASKGANAEYYEDFYVRAIEDLLASGVVVLADDVAAQVREARLLVWAETHAQFCHDQGQGAIDCTHRNPYAAPSAATGQEDETHG